MVSIRLVMNGGIIDRAEKGTKAYSETEVQEQIKLAHSEFEMQKYGANPETNEATFLHTKLDPLYGAANVDITGTDPLMVTVKNAGNTYAIKIAANGSTEQVEWIQDKTVVKNTKTGHTFEVGDTVFYNSGVEEYEGIGDNQGKWGILGVENGNILIMSKENIGNVTLGGKQDWLSTGTTKLNNTCSQFKNTAYADSVRSVKVEDINRIIGFVPPEPTEYQFTMQNGIVCRNNIESEYGVKNFEDINGKKLPEDEIPTVFDNYYNNEFYRELNNKASSLLYVGYAGPYYWLNNKYIWATTNGASWGFCYSYYAGLGHEIFWDSNSGGMEYEHEYGVRAVVSLKSNIKLVGDGAVGYTLQI